MGALSQLQANVVERLQADPYWTGVEIITEKKGDLITDIETTVAQLGFCVVVVTPVFQFFNPLTLNFEGYADVAIMVYENVLLNSSGIHACDACEHAVTQLHGWAHKVPACDGAVPVLISIADGIKFSDVGPPLHYTAQFRAHVTLQN